MHARPCTHGIPSTDHIVVPAYGHQYAENQNRLTERSQGLTPIICATYTGGGGGGGRDSLPIPAKFGLAEPLYNC